MMHEFRKKYWVKFAALWSVLNTAKDYKVQQVTGTHIYAIATNFVSSNKAQL